MKQHDIAMTDMRANGCVELAHDEALLRVKTHRQNTRFYAFEMPIDAYIAAPKTYRLPLRVDIRVKLDAPSFYVMLGAGHVSFGPSFLDNRRIGDILSPDTKKVTAFDSALVMDVFHDISVIYDIKHMLVLVDGEERYFSQKEDYMKSPALRETGFELKLAGAKYNTLDIAAVTVTEYEEGELAALFVGRQPSDRRNICLSIDKKAAATLDECLSALPPALRGEMARMDAYLLQAKDLKMKRKLEGTSQACRISYVSSWGFAYHVHIQDAHAEHFFWWYMVSNYTYNDRYMGRKNDFTEDTLKKVAETMPDVAARLFSYYDACVGCTPTCSVRTAYTYEGTTLQACHGKMVMNLNLPTLQDLCWMLEAIRAVLAG